MDDQALVVRDGVFMAPVLYRSAEIVMERLDEEKRTVELSFSSEEPVRRWFGMEILDHTPTSVELGRLNGGGALLLEHDPNKHIGTVEKAWIGKDRKGRAEVRFGTSELAEQAFQDVRERIKHAVSVGYRLKRLVRDGIEVVKEAALFGDADDDDKGENEKKVKKWRAIRWMPLEVSLVAVAADPNVGIGRGTLEGELEPVRTEEAQTNREELILDGKETRAASVTIPPMPASPVDVEAIRAEAAKQAMADMQRNAETMLALGKQHDQLALAGEYIAAGRSVGELQSALLEKFATKPMHGLSAEPIGLKTREIERYSFRKAMLALDTGDWSQAGFEAECSRAQAEVLGRQPSGVFVPVDVIARTDRIFSGEAHERELAMYGKIGYEARANEMTTGTGSAPHGGYTVQTNVLAASFIELLRHKMVLSTLGATYLTGLTGPVDIPSHVTGATTYWVAEAADITQDTAFDFGRLQLTPKTVGVFHIASRRLLMQSSLSIEALLRNTMSADLGHEIDKAGIQYDGTGNKPVGILNWTGIGSETFAASGNPTYAETLAVWEEVAKDDALVGALAWAASATVAMNMMQREKATGTAKFVWNEETNRVMTYPALVSEQVTANTLLFGNFNDAVVAEFGVLDLNVDRSLGAKAGNVYFIALMDVDTGVRIASSFCKGT